MKLFFAPVTHIDGENLLFKKKGTYKGILGNFASNLVGFVRSWGSQ